MSRLLGTFDDVEGGAWNHARACFCAPMMMMMMVVVVLLHGNGSGEATVQDRVPYMNLLRLVELHRFDLCTIFPLRVHRIQQTDLLRFTEFDSFDLIFLFHLIIHRFQEMHFGGLMGLFLFMVVVFFRIHKFHEVSLRGFSKFGSLNRIVIHFLVVWGFW